MKKFLLLIAVAAVLVSCADNGEQPLSGSSNRGTGSPSYQPGYSPDSKSMLPPIIIDGYRYAYREILRYNGDGLHARGDFYYIGVDAEVGSMSYGQVRSTLKKVMDILSTNGDTFSFDEEMIDDHIIPWDDYYTIKMEVKSFTPEGAAAIGFLLGEMLEKESDGQMWAERVIVHLQYEL